MREALDLETEQRTNEEWAGWQGVPGVTHTRTPCGACAPAGEREEGDY